MTKIPEALAALDGIIDSYLDGDDDFEIHRAARKARSAFAELIDKTDAVAGFLVGYGDVAELAAGQLREALAAIEVLK